MNHNNAFIIDNSMNNFQQMNLMINPLEYQMEQYQIAQQQIYYQKYMNEIKFKNQIKIKFKVNSDFRKTNNEIKFFNKLDNIDKNDIEIYINDIKFEYQNWFIPKKEGVYNIILIFKII